MRCSGLITAAAIAFLYSWGSACADADTSGRNLFQGFRPFQAGPEATNRNLPTSFAACANCHGVSGAGKLEGGVQIPPVDIRSLTGTRGILPGFATGEMILAAIENGVGRGGRPLGSIMPRYNLTDEEARALLLYLSEVGTREDQPHGVSSSNVRLGTLLPVTGPLADEGKAILAGMQETVETLNSNGGIYGRRIVLVTQDVAKDPLGALETLLKGNIYAVVGGMWPANETELEERLAAAHVSAIASLVVRDSPPTKTSWITDMMAPRDSQEQRLQSALLACKTVGPRWLLITRREDKTGPLAEGIEAVDRTALDTPERSEPGCIGYDIARLQMVEEASLDGWQREVVLPFPSALLRGDDSNIWRRLGQAAIKVTAEALSASGAGLHERSLLEALPDLKGFEPIDGAPIQFSPSHKVAWDPDILSLGPTSASQR